MRKFASVCVWHIPNVLIDLHINGDVLFLLYEVGFERSEGGKRAKYIRVVDAPAWQPL